MAEEKEGAVSGLISELEELQSEFSQLSELAELERSYALRVVEALKAIQTEVDVAIRLDPEALRGYKGSVREVYLLPEAVLMLAYEGGGSESRPLSKFPSEVVLSVLQAAAPELRKQISQRRRQVGARVHLFERILKGLKRAEALLAHEEAEEEGTDAVRAALESA